MSQLITILVLDTVNTGSSVQLGAEQLIRLDKPIKFLAQICVLGLKHRAVPLQCVLLCEQVVVMSAHLCVYLALPVDVPPGLV